MTRQKPEWHGTPLPPTYHHKHHTHTHGHTHSTQVHTQTQKHYVVTTNTIGHASLIGYAALLDAGAKRRPG